MKVKVNWKLETVTLEFSGSRRRTVIEWMPIAQAKRLQQLLQAELGVPADRKRKEKR